MASRARRSNQRGRGNPHRNTAHANSLAVGYFIDDSTTLAQAEAALTTTQLSLRTLSQAVLLAEDVTLGAADRKSAATAAGEAARVVDDLETRIEELNLEATNALAYSREVLAHLDEGNIADAGDLLATDALAAYEGLQYLT